MLLPLNAISFCQIKLEPVLIIIQYALLWIQRAAHVFILHCPDGHSVRHLAY